ASDGDWFNTSTPVTLTADQTVANGAGSRYDFRTWSGDVTGSPTATNPVTVTMDQARSITANYATQFSVTFTHTGLTADASGTVLTIGLDTYERGDFNVVRWVDSGGSLSYAFSANLASTTAGKRFHLSNTPGTSLTNITSAQIVNGAYTVQWQLSLATNPVGVGNAAISGASDGDWFNTGSSVTLTADQNVAIAAGSRYDFRTWTGEVATPPNATNPITVVMNQARSITANYATQYAVTFTQTGLTADASGTVLTVGL